MIASPIDPSDAWDTLIKQPIVGASSDAAMDGRMSRLAASIRSRASGPHTRKLRKKLLPPFPAQSSTSADYAEFARFALIDPAAEGLPALAIRAERMIYSSAAHHQRCDTLGHECRLSASVP